MTPYCLLMAREGFGVAMPLGPDTDVDRRLSQRLRRSGVIEDAPLSTWARDGGAPGPDWVWGTYQMPLVSDSFRRVVGEYLTERDEVQWLPTTLRNADGTEEARWIPHLPGERDILDVERTDWGPSGLPIAWVLSPEKMQGISFITRPQHSGTLIVSGDIMRALRRAKLTGFTVMRARIADPKESAE